MNKPIHFNFENQNIDVVSTNGVAWLIAADVVRALGLKDTSKALRAVSNKDKLLGKIVRGGQPKVIWTINESGLYTLIMRSTKPEARRFRDWVTSEVLPAIRQTGEYKVPGQKKLSSGRVRHNRLTPERLLDIMKDVALIEDQGIRLRLMSKLGL